MEKKNNLYLRATAEMLADEGLVIAVLKQLLQDEMVALMYDSSARQFMPSCYAKYRMIIDADHNVIHFEIINDGLFMTVHPSKVQRYIFKEVKNEYARRKLRALYRKLYNQFN